ncbi:MAG: TIGR01777 family oxidoreductase, partial [Ilumatobacteraceae bacterium]|nr:TIGR01777 family oxidoreductase [Ilumatobacteraceae bacterium]
VVHLAGAGIGDHRWTAEYKREILDSRVRSTTLLAETIASCTQRPPVFLSGSAIGIYGASDDRELDEQSPVGSGFLADTCRQWEAAALPAAAAGTRVAYLRTGIVLTPKGGALKKMLPLFKLFAGGRFGNGKQWQSWISLPDEVGAICHLLTSDVEGPVNLTAPNPVTNAGFVKVLGKAMGRPSVLPVPSFGPKLLLGSELAEALLFTGQNVLPKVLQHSGYHFRHPRLDEAFAALLS